MNRAKRIISTAIGVALISGLSFVGAPRSDAASESVKSGFITSLVGAAQAAQRQYGVPASVSIAQAAVNTDYGTDTLATSAHNFFGTHCTASLSAAQFAQLAEAQVGKPYILGAEAAISNANPSAFDCSELVQWLFGRSGNPITDLAASQYSATRPVSGSPKTGDLVFLRNNPARANGIGHVAVLTKKLSNGDWEIIEARGHLYGVVKTTLSYWKARKYYAGLRRYAKLNFAGDSGVASNSAASSYQSSCTTINGTKYATFPNPANSVLGHAAIVAAGSEYAAARNAQSNTDAFVDAIAAAEHSSGAAGYAKSLRQVISSYNLTQYDVAPLSVVLLSGNSGVKVSSLQYLLTAAGYNVAVSGTFNSATASAVKKFQKAKGLLVDGQAGPSTITALMGTVKQGDSGRRVDAVKTLLRFAGYGTETGSTLGPVTAASLRAFQSNTGLAASGATDAKTWSRLFMLIEVAPVPTIAGKTTVGQQLAAATAPWGPGKVGVTYQWLRGTTPIAGANAATYALQPADAGQPIRVVTTGSKASYTPVSRVSAATAPVTPAKLTATPVPKIAGDPATGKILTAVPGVWGPAPVTLGFQWYRGKTAIKGANAATYQLQGADYKAKISLTVTGAKAGFFTVAKASATTKAVGRGSFTGAPNPTIAGTPALGQTLKAVTGVWTPAPGAFKYQWYRGSTAIKGATHASYKLVKADRGKAIKLKVTSNNKAFHTVSKYSAATAKVSATAKASAPKWTASPAPKITGTAKAGKTLAVTAGNWSPAPALSYQWYRNGKAIAKATSAQYRLTTADQHMRIEVAVTATKAGYPTAVVKASITVG